MQVKPNPFNHGWLMFVSSIWVHTGESENTNKSLDSVQLWKFPQRGKRKKSNCLCSRGSGVMCQLHYIHRNKLRLSLDILWETGTTKLLTDTLISAKVYQPSGQLPLVALLCKYFGFTSSVLWESLHCGALISEGSKMHVYITEECNQLQRKETCFSSVGKMYGVPQSAHCFIRATVFSVIKYFYRVNVFLSSTIFLPFRYSCSKFFTLYFSPCVFFMCGFLMSPWHLKSLPYLTFSEGFHFPSFLFFLYSLFHIPLPFPPSIIFIY